MPQDVAPPHCCHLPFWLLDPNHTPCTVTIKAMLSFWGQSCECLTSPRGAQVHIHKILNTTLLIIFPNTEAVLHFWTLSQFTTLVKLKEHKQFRISVFISIQIMSPMVSEGSKLCASHQRVLPSPASTLQGSLETVWLLSATETSSKFSLFWNQNPNTFYQVIFIHEPVRPSCRSIVLHTVAKWTNWNLPSNLCKYCTNRGMLTGFLFTLAGSLTTCTHRGVTIQLFPPLKKEINLGSPLSFCLLGTFHFFF